MFELFLAFAARPSLAALEVVAEQVEPAAFFRRIDRTAFYATLVLMPEIGSPSSPGGQGFTVFVDSKPISSADYVASESIPAGQLVAIGFRSEIVIADGETTASLKLDPNKPIRQRIGVDATVPGLRITYLKKNEGWI